MAGIADMLIGGFESGNALRVQRENEQKQRGLASLFSQAYASDNPRAMLPQIAGISPEAAIKAQGSFAELDEAQGAEVAQTAQIFTRVMTPEQRVQAWPAIRAGLAKRIPQAQYPEQWDESLLPQANEIAELLSQKYGGGKGVPSGYQEFSLLSDAGGLTPEERARAAKVRLGIEGRASNAGFGFDMVEDRFGNPRPQRRNPRDGSIEVFHDESGQWMPLGGMDGPSMGAPQGGDPFGFLAQAGATVTSGQRSAEHNAKVGGVPNSYHLTGQARDIAPPRDPQQAAFIRQQAAANGLEVIDEGDHWHLEPRGNAPHVAGLGVGRRAEDEAYATELAKGQAGLQIAPAQTAADAERERQLRIAQAAGEAQGAARFGSSDGREAAREASKKLPQLQEVVRMTDRIAQAVDDLDGTFINTGPLDQYVQKFTEEGQTLTSDTGAIQNSMLALTRVPGVGSQSDLEQKVSQLKYPQLGLAPSVNKRRVEDLRAFVRDLTAAYQNVLSGKAQGDAPQPSGGMSAGTNKSLRFNPATGKIE